MSISLRTPWGTAQTFELGRKSAGLGFAEVSGRHLCLDATSSELTVRDHGSTNGTILIRKFDPATMLPARTEGADVTATMASLAPEDDGPDASMTSMGGGATMSGLRLPRQATEPPDDVERALASGLTLIRISVEAPYSHLSGLYRAESARSLMAVEVGKDLVILASTRMLVFEDAEVNAEEAAAGATNAVVVSVIAVKVSRVARR